MKAIVALLAIAVLSATASAQFQYCGSGVPYNVTLPPHSTQWLFVWNTQGNKFCLSCISVVAPSDNKIFVDVSLAYSPNHAAGPFSILRPLSTQYDLNADVKENYPTEGYFYLVATNMLPVSVTIQYQADGNVSSSKRPTLHSSAGMPNLGQRMHAVPRRPDAHFGLCEKDFNTTIPARSAQNLMYWTQPAMTLTVICLEVTAAQRNPSSLELWIACGPAASSGPVVKLMRITNQAQPEASIRLDCPIKGYFRFTAFNNDGTPANLQFGASGNVFLPDGSVNSETALA